MTVGLYQPPLRYGAAYDESSADGLNPRPHWAHLMESLQAIAPLQIAGAAHREFGAGDFPPLNVLSALLLLSSYSAIALLGSTMAPT